MQGLGLSQMNALLSSQTALKSVAEMDRNRNTLQGEKGVLASQIKADKGRGIDTKAKEERYTEIEENVSILVNLISDGYETREVECEIKFHYPEKNKKTFINPFTEEEVTEDMNTYDHNLFNQFEEVNVEESEDSPGTEQEPKPKRGRGRKSEQADEQTY